MPLWKEKGLLSFVLCLQGGNPQGYRKDQPWVNPAYTPQGEILPEYKENEIIVSIKEMLPKKQETISPVVKAIREIVAIHEENNNIDNDLLRLIKFI